MVGNHAWIRQICGNTDGCAPTGRRLVNKMFLYSPRLSPLIKSKFPGEYLTQTGLGALPRVPEHTHHLGSVALQPGVTLIYALPPLITAGFKAG